MRWWRFIALASLLQLTVAAAQPDMCKRGELYVPCSWTWNGTAWAAPPTPKPPVQSAEEKRVQACDDALTAARKKCKGNATCNTEALIAHGRCMGGS